MAGSVAFSFRSNDGDLFLRQPIQLVDQRVDLPVRGLDLPSVECSAVGYGGCGQLLVQLQHAFTSVTIRSCRATSAGSSKLIVRMGSCTKNCLFAPRYPPRKLELTFFMYQSSNLLFRSPVTYFIVPNA